MSVALKLGVLFAFLVVGVAGRAAGVFDERRREWLSWFAFYVALPALVFMATYAQPLREVLEPALVVGFLAVVAVMVAVGWVVHAREPGNRTKSVAVVQSYHTNLGLLGFPLVAASFGPVTTAKASIVLGIGALTQVPVTTALLVWMNGADASVRGEAKRVLTTPVIPALLVGMAFSALHVGIPGGLASVLDALASLALPVGVTYIGACLATNRGAVDPGTVGRVVGMKVLLMPAVAFLVFSALGAEWTTVQAGVGMVAAPTAVSTSILVSELGGDPELASMNVFASTVASVGTFFLVVRFLL